MHWGKPLPLGDGNSFPKMSLVLHGWVALPVNNCASSLKFAHLGMAVRLLVIVPYQLVIKVVTMAGPRLRDNK
jgi:hypothetical protein